MRILSQREAFAYRRTASAPLLVPTEHLIPHMIYDRSTMMEQSKPEFQRLLKDVRANGIQQPVTMETDGTRGILGDGNNRLGVAQVAGIAHVPTRFVRENTSFLTRSGAQQLHPSLRQHLAEHPEAIQEDVERQPSWQQGEYP